MTAQPNADRPVLVVRDVTKRFQRGPETVNAVEAVSFTLAAHELVVLEGPSGSGKTTLLDVILGWMQPDIGTVEGIPGSPDWSALAVIPQRLGLLDHLTLGENVDLPARARRGRGKRPVSEAANAEMELLGIAHLADRFPYETSLGEQQRAACARALVASPRLLIADEPTSHQDEVSAHRLIDRLRAVVQTGSAVLAATHDDRIVAAADRVLRIDDGVLQEHEPRL